MWKFNEHLIHELVIYWLFDVKIWSMNLLLVVLFIYLFILGAFKHRLPNFFFFFFCKSYIGASS